QRASNEPTAVPTHYWFQRPVARAPEPVSIASIPSLIAALDTGVTLCFGTLDELPENDRDVFRRCGFRAGAVVPLSPSGQDGVLAALAFGSTTHEQTWAAAIVERLRLIAGVMGQALARKASHIALQQAHDEIRRLRD